MFASKYDIIFIQREAFKIGGAFFEYLLSKLSSKIIFDFDDAIWLPDVSSGNEGLGWLKYPKKVSSIIKLSNMVFVGNNFLAKYAMQYHKNVKIIPRT